MVHGLTVAIYNSPTGKSPEVEASAVAKRGSTHSFVIDGVSLAYLVVTNKDPDRGWEYANGGDYQLYANRMVDFFKSLNSLGAKCLIVFPLPNGTAPVSDALVSKWTSSAHEMIRRINRTRQFVEKGNYPAKNLMEVLPPFVVTLIAETANKLRIPVVYTRNNIIRFLARFVAAGEADAVIGQDTDYILFPGVKYIPIDSFYHNKKGVLCCDYMDSTFVSEAIGLSDEKNLLDLSILLGNACSELLMSEKYNVYIPLKVMPDPKDPACLVKGLVEFFNKEGYPGSLEIAPPFGKFYVGDPEFEKVVKDSREFFDISQALQPEGGDLIRKEVEKGQLPLWAVCIAEGGDFWVDPIVDDYKHDVQACKVTLPYRKLMYGILGRTEVVEHQITETTIITCNVKAEVDIPEFGEIRRMNPEQLSKAFYKIAHQNFPNPPVLEKDPLVFLEEPAKTVGFALRYLVAQCFTRNQTPYTKTPQNNPKFKELKIIGAPPLDYFELRSLAAQALILMMVNLDTYKAPEFQPKMRRIHVGALYQTVMAHMMWLQQFFGQKSPRISPHLFYNGQLFAAVYNSLGDIGSDEFSSYFEDPGKIRLIEEKRLDPFLKTILYPFPDNLFSVFESCPRSVRTSVYDENKTVSRNSRFTQFGNQKDSDEEEDVNKMDADTAALIDNAPPTPPPPKATVKKQEKDAFDEDEQMAFLLEAAASNKGGPKIVQAAAQKKPKTTAKRHLPKFDLDDLNKQTFTKKGVKPLKSQAKSFKMIDD